MNFLFRQFSFDERARAREFFFTLVRCYSTISHSLMCCTLLWDDDDDGGSGGSVVGFRFENKGNNNGFSGTVGSSAPQCTGTFTH